MKLKLLLIVILLVASHAHAGEMDLLMRMTAEGLAGDDTAKWSRSAVSSEAGPLVPCLVKSNDVYLTSAFIEEMGGRVLGVAGMIIIAEVPARGANAVAKCEEVTAVEAGVPMKRKMDTARNASFVDVVQDGGVLESAYNGKNVIIGVADDALDYGHPDFLGPDDFTRIQYMQQTEDGAVLECTKRTIADETCQITDGGQGTTHGTHVTGIAAGADSTYTGVGLASDIMFVFVSPEDADPDDESAASFSTQVLEAVTTIFAKADTMDKPAVVNLSLGTSIGAHDGTSLLEEGLTTLTGTKAGRIVINAAGNEQVVPADFPSTYQSYVGGIHASVNSEAGQGTAARLAIWNGSGVGGTYVGATMVDVWLDEGQKDNCSIAVFAYSNGRSALDFAFPGLVSTDNSSLATGDIPFANDTASAVTATSGAVDVAVQVDSEDIRNLKPHAIALISASSGNSASNLESYWYDVVIRASGGPCTGHMWLYYDYTPYHDFLTNVAGGSFNVAAGLAGAGYNLSNGDSLCTMTIPATARGVLAVGSWMPAKPIGAQSSKWTGGNGVTYDQSDVSTPGGTGSVTFDVSGFSSLGPTADGRTRPDFVAPGEPIISTKARNTTISQAITIGTDHMKMAGTSMSSPHAAGIAALLLERNNTLGVDAVRTALQTSASTDGMTVKTPNPANTYGAGKVNAAAALGSVAIDTSAYRGTGDLDPVDSGGGCSLILPAH